jgi:hypothetical protein
MPNWNSLDSVRHIHSELEAIALVFFALLVVFDVLAHLSGDKKKERLLEKAGLCFFAVAVLAEIAAYPYGQRNDTLSEQLVGSLDLKATDASAKASKALTDSDEAEIKSGNAIDNADEAKTSAGSAETKAAVVGKQATFLQSRLAESMERTTRLESQLSWRSVSPEQVEVMKRFFCQSRSHRLLPFLGKKIAFSYLSGDAEAGEYAEELAAALRVALAPLGAEVVEPTSVTIYGSGPPPKGLFLQTKSSKDSLALALQRALKDAGVDAPGELTQPVEQADVNLFVAIKPRGFLATSSAEMQKAIAALPPCEN